jgi:hypothetical protein
MQQCFPASEIYLPLQMLQLTQTTRLAATESATHYY